MNQQFNFVCSGGMEGRPGHRYDEIYNPQWKRIWTLRQQIWR